MATYAFSLRINAEYEEYLKEAAWKAKKSITQYINDLIAEDKRENEEGNKDVK